MTLTKAQIITTIHNTISLNSAQLAQLVETPKEIITSTLSVGEDLMISGFVKFQISNNNHKRVRTTQTANHLLPEVQR